MSGNESQSRGQEPRLDTKSKNTQSRQTIGKEDLNKRPDPEKLFKERTQGSEDKISKIKSMQTKTMNAYNSTIQNNMKLMKGIAAPTQFATVHKSDVRSFSTRGVNKKPTPLSMVASTNNTVSSLHETFSLAHSCIEEKKPLPKPGKSELAPKESKNEIESYGKQVIDNWDHVREDKEKVSKAHQAKLDNERIKSMHRQTAQLNRKPKNPWGTYSSLLASPKPMEVITGVMKEQIEYGVIKNSEGCDSDHDFNVEENSHELDPAERPINPNGDMRDYKINQVTKINDFFNKDKNLREGRQAYWQRFKDLKELTDKEGVDIIDLRDPSKLKVLKGYKLGRILGKGASAVVREATHIENNGKVAIKIYDRFDQYNTFKKKSIISEVHNLRCIKHKNIVEMLDFYEGERYVCLIMEFGGSFSLLDYIQRQKNLRLSEQLAKPIIRQLVSALSYCHSLHIYHRDIKLDNVLMDEDGVIKIIDFGFSTQMKPGEKAKNFCGSYAFASPEIIQNKPYLPQFADVWAMGVLIYFMIAGFFPFQDETKSGLCKKIVDNSVYYPPYFSEPLTELLKEMLLTSPTCRITFEKVLQDPWLCSDL